MNYDDTAKFELQSSQRQPFDRTTLDGANERAEKSATRPVVRITSYRCRLLDEDNLKWGCKSLQDALRYAGAIPGDSPEDIESFTTQIKVAHRKDEKTTVEIEYP